MATSRFDVERAVLRSGMPAPSRHLCHVLCTYVDADEGVILPRFQPSLTQLARDTGMHRRTVMRHLNELEKLGWVTRKRPAPEDARKKHARTQYGVRIGRNSRDTEAPELGTESHGPGDRKAPELGTQKRVPRDAAPHQSSMSSKSSGEEIRAVIEAIRARAGVTVSESWAERVADQILGARDKVRDPVAVVRSVIGRAPRDTYAPTPQPPRFTAARGFD